MPGQPESSCLTSGRSWLTRIAVKTSRQCFGFTAGAPCLHRWTFQTRGQEEDVGLGFNYCELLSGVCDLHYTPTYTNHPSSLLTNHAQRRRQSLVAFQVSLSPAAQVARAGRAPTPRRTADLHEGRAKCAAAVAIPVGEAEKP